MDPNQSGESIPSNQLLNRSHQALTNDHFFKKYANTLVQQLNESNNLPSANQSFEMMQMRSKHQLESTDQLGSSQPSLFRLQSKMSQMAEPARQKTNLTDGQDILSRRVTFNKELLANQEVVHGSNLRMFPK